MAKKMTKKPTKKVKNVPPRTATGVDNPDAQGGQGKFDFGGLPDRDLKKNLGCG